MKKAGLYFTLGLAVAMGGCNKFLEKEPDNRAKLNSPEKVAQLIASAYPKGNYMAFAEAISDNVNDRGNGGTSYEMMDAYMFRDIRSNDQDSPEWYWNSCYEAIAAANQALQAIKEAPDPQNYNAQKGEALVARAYSHFMLVNFFAKFYNASTAATDPGIPYVTEPETVVVKQYDRGTVKAVYDSVEKDLLAGLPLIKDEKYSVPSYHFTQTAANAFATRFYLFKRDYPKALTYSANVVPASEVASRLRPWNNKYRNMTRLELMANYQKASEPANLLLAEAYSLWGRNYITGRYNFDPVKARQIGYYDYILDLNGDAEYAMGFQMYGGDNMVYIPKVNEYFVKASVNAEIGYPHVMVPLFTMEEALFNRAEALTYSNRYDEAIALLNAYVSTRIVNYDPAKHTLTQARILAFYVYIKGVSDMRAAMIEAILRYKQSEFIHEGQRWFDILRYQVPVTHEIKGGSPITLSASSPMRVFQIPQSAVLSGVALNPR